MEFVLPLGTRCLVDASGVALRGGAANVALLPNGPPNENVLPATRNVPASGGGAGISWTRECGEDTSSGGGISVEEGSVDEELSRVEVELS